MLHQGTPTAAGNSGTSGDASRSDHIDDAFSISHPSIISVVAALGGTGAIGIPNNGIMFTVGSQIRIRTDIGTTAPGPRPFASRDDHIHGSGLCAAIRRGNWVSAGTYASAATRCTTAACTGYATRPTGGSCGTPGSTNGGWYGIVGIEADQSTSVTGSGLGGNEIGDCQYRGLHLLRYRTTRLALPSYGTDATERLCPDPSEGTTGTGLRDERDGNYALRGSNLGSGGGTDDQTADEVANTGHKFQRGSLGCPPTTMCRPRLRPWTISTLRYLPARSHGTLTETSTAADNDVQAAFETLRVDLTVIF